MGGCVVQVWFRPEFEITSRQGGFDLIETELPDFAAFCELADADGLIGGAQLYTRPGEVRGERIVTRRHPIAFRGSAVARCQLPSWMFVQEEIA